MQDKFLEDQLLSNATLQSRGKLECFILRLGYRFLKKERGTERMVRVGFAHVSTY